MHFVNYNPGTLTEEELMALKNLPIVPVGYGYVSFKNGTGGYGEFVYDPRLIPQYDQMHYLEEFVDTLLKIRIRIACQ